MVEDLPKRRGETAEQVELILREVDRLPTLGPVGARLLDMGANDDVELDEISTLLESDPALSATVLALVRRAERGLGDRVATVRHAVGMLGLDAVRSIALSVLVYELMTDKGERLETQGRFDHTGFWKHCVAVACAAEHIARVSKAAPPERAFIAGLLHDLGKLVLEMVLPRAYARVIELASRRRSDAAPIERLVVGIDHHTAALRLMERWNLPAELKDAVWLHGQPAPDDLPHRGLIACVTAGDALAREHFLGWAADWGEPVPLARALAEAGIDTPPAALIEPVVAALTHRCCALGLDNETPTEVLMRSVAAANARLAAMSERLRERAKHATEHARILAAVGKFHAQLRGDERLPDALARVAENAEDVIGPGFCAAVTQRGPQTPWRITLFGEQGRTTRSAVYEAPPHDREDEATLASLGRSHAVPLSALAALPWLAEALCDTVDVRSVCALPLVVQQQLACLLVLDSRSVRSLDDAGIAALTASWGAAVLSAEKHEAASRLGERLAVVNRSLADTQARLTERESLARLGEMSAGAAHEMNNPLTIIRGRSQILTEACQGQRERAAAKAIADAATDLAGLIESLHLLADPPKPQPAPVSGRAILVLAREKAAARLKATSAVAIAADDAAPPAVIDPEQVATALAEVIINAVEANPNGPVEVTAHHDAAEGRMVIRVTDQGQGMSDRARRHAFDPFFSEKPAGRQRGLGLARARRLIELSGGEIGIEQAPGTGTTVTVTLNTGAMERAAA